ncbi:hypothetical protein Tco_0265284 [Tanacetum coccineum]
MAWSYKDKEEDGAETRNFTVAPLDDFKTSVPTLSALQLVKGVKKGEESFVAGDEENGSSEDDSLPGLVVVEDIVVYSGTLEEHVEHLRVVFQILRDNQLYVKKEKGTEEFMWASVKSGVGTAFLTAEPVALVHLTIRRERKETSFNEEGWRGSRSEGRQVDLALPIS